MARLPFWGYYTTFALKFPGSACSFLKNILLNCDQQWTLLEKGRDSGPPLPVAEEGGAESPQPHRFPGRL